jgi:phage FluMu gp28-like protein
VTFTAPVKEQLAYQLRADFQDQRLRIARDDDLRADLLAVQKEVTDSGNIRFVGESEDGHCDRFWAKALRQQAAQYRSDCVGALVA